MSIHNWAGIIGDRANVVGSRLSSAIRGFLGTVLDGYNHQDARDAALAEVLSGPVKLFVGDGFTTSPDEHDPTRTLYVRRSSRGLTAAQLGGAADIEYVFVGESKDASIALVSQGEGSHGSAVDFMEVNDGTLNSRWTIVRGTSVAQGTPGVVVNSLNFYYGTDNDYSNNTRFVEFLPNGSIYCRSDIGSDKSFDDDNPYFAFVGGDCRIRAVAWDEGEWGAAFVLDQLDSSNTPDWENAWAIIRQTNGDGGGDGRLVFTYGTDPDPALNTPQLTLHSNGNIIVAGVGPHAIGTAAQGFTQLRISGAFTGDGSGSELRSIALDTALTSAAGDTSLRQVRIGGSITTAGGGDTITNIDSVLIVEPNITLGGVDTVTNAATLRIADAPTEGTNNYALHVDSGAAKFDGRMIRERQAFGADDATPSVAAGSYFVTANANATTITDFDNAVSGQEIVVEIGDANTTVDFTSSGLKGNAGGDWSPTTGDFMRCIYNGTDWLCSVHDTTA